MTRKQMLSQIRNGSLTLPQSGVYFCQNPNAERQQDFPFAQISSRNGEDIDSVIDEYRTAPEAIDAMLQDWSPEQIIKA